MHKIFDLIGMLPPCALCRPSAAPEASAGMLPNIFGKGEASFGGGKGGKEEAWPSLGGEESTSALQAELSSQSLGGHLMQQSACQRPSVGCFVFCSACGACLPCQFCCALAGSARRRAEQRQSQPGRAPNAAKCVAAQQQVLSRAYDLIRCGRCAVLHCCYVVSLWLRH